MDKAVIGVFPDNATATRGINDLKAYGFGGENMHHVLRDDLPRDRRLTGPRLIPGMEILKGIVLGAIVGGILGAVAYKVFGMSLTSPYSLPNYGVSQQALTTVLVFAVAGAICGLIEGLAAMGPLAAAARALSLRHRSDALVTVHTDETHAARADDIMRAAGATDVRRGASSVPGEFQTVETVQPEAYGTTQLVQRESVAAPETATEHVDTTTTTEGGAIG